MGRARVAALLLPLVLDAPAAAAQEFDTRVAVGSGVACRARPDRAAAAVSTLRLGEPFFVRGRTADAAGADWFEVAGLRTPCFVFGPLTVPFSGFDRPDEALVAIADHALMLGAGAGFEHLVAVDNLLLERRLRRRRNVRAPAAVPPILELRHLQIVGLAAQAIGGRLATERDPLRMAWVLAHATDVGHFEPGDTYFVSGERFWALYDRHPTSPIAEEIAWAAARTPALGDECYTACLLTALAQTYMRYWRQFPAGSHVMEAVQSGLRRVGFAARYCPMIASGELEGEKQPIAALVADMRESLQRVSIAGKDDLLRIVADIEATCLGPAVDLNSPRAIPQLVKALGSGFTMVPRQLAAFGEDAAPAVLDLVRTPGLDRSVVQDGLRALRLMIDNGGAPPLSAATRERILQALSEIR